jgi:broad specificity phosphatase PhoE
MTARFSLISHAGTEAQRNAAFPLDEPITERERIRMAGLDGNMPKAEKMWSAPEQRAQQTFRILGLSGMSEDELRECDYGNWQGRRMEDVQADAPEGFMEWLTVPKSAPHGGESIEHLVHRVGKWMDDQSGVRHTIAVTHPAVVRAAIVHALRLPLQNFWRFDISPVTLTDLRFTGSVWTVRCVGCSISMLSAREDNTSG